MSKTIACPDCGKWITFKEHRTIVRCSECGKIIDLKNERGYALRGN